MCNLYKMRNSVGEIARLFGVEPDHGANFGEDVYPGYPGLVVAGGKARAMTWGLPITLTGKQGQKLRLKPMNNARDDWYGWTAGAPDEAFTLCQTCTSDLIVERTAEPWVKARQAGAFHRKA